MASNSEWVRFGTIAQLCAGRILDWGCGSGHMTTAISVFGHETYGIDNSDKNIQTARRRARKFGLNCRFRNWKETNVSLPDSSFDTVILNSSKEEIKRDVFAEKVKEAVRLCAPDGRILISGVFNSNNGFLKSLLEKRIENQGIKLDNFLYRKDKDIKSFIGYAKNNKPGKQSHINLIKDDFFLDHIPIKPLNSSEKVSVIIPTYNRAHFLPRCLDSILRQTYSNLEVIVVNDGSNDNTDEIIRPYLYKIKYLKKENGGKSTALNRGLEEATGEYVWIFDDDDIALPRKLEMDIRMLQRQEDIDIVHSFGYRLDDESGEILSMYMNELRQPDEVFRGILIWPQILNITVVAKRKCYEIAGLFREDLVRCQDYEMWFRLAQRFKIHLLECGTVFARIHKGVRGNAKERFYSPEECSVYERKIFSGIYKDYALSYFYPDFKVHADDQYSHAMALMERAKIMNIHGLRDLASLDLERISEIVKEPSVRVDEAFIDRLINMWQQAVMKKKNIFAFDILKCLRSISQNYNEHNFTNYVSKRYFWSFYHNLKSLKLKHSIQRLLIGLSFLFIMLRQKYIKGY
jgi:glycosyltransferase involved in cell wall biosynthesis/ubiquinone/menaquinone biosynthesis C-methylase UbiE